MRRLAQIVVLTLASGCVTPSIPIPPPDPGEMDFALSSPLPDGSTDAVLTYPADQNYAGGVVYVFNHDTGMGVFQNVNADSTIGPTQPLEANIGAQVVVTIDAGPETVSRCVVLQSGLQDPDSYCSF
jgi:hypothetical protein